MKTIFSKVFPWNLRFRVAINLSYSNLSCRAETLCIIPIKKGSEITDPSENQSRGDKRKQSDQSEDGTVSKHCRFELEPENIENEWNLPPLLASYVNEDMPTHTSEKKYSLKITDNQSNSS